MRFTVFHCHNSACGHRVWVPIDKLGCRGRCPECGHIMEIPADFSAEHFFEGPDMFQELDQVAETVGAGRD